MRFPWSVSGASSLVLLSGLLLFVFSVDSTPKQEAHTESSQVGVSSRDQGPSKAVLERVERSLASGHSNAALLFSAEGELMGTYVLSAQHVTREITALNYVQGNPQLMCNSPQLVRSLSNAVRCEDGRIIVLVREAIEAPATKVPGEEFSEVRKRSGPSKEVMEKVERELEQTAENSIVVFGSDGNKQRSRVLSEQELSRFDAFREILKKVEKGCKNPQIISPSCVQCEDGTIICTNAKKFQVKPAKAEEPMDGDI